MLKIDSSVESKLVFCKLGGNHNLEEWIAEQSTQHYKDFIKLSIGVCKLMMVLHYMFLQRPKTSYLGHPIKGIILARKS